MAPSRKFLFLEEEKKKKLLFVDNKYFMLNVVNDRLNLDLLFDCIIPTKKSVEIDSKTKITVMTVC